MARLAALVGPALLAFALGGPAHAKGASTSLLSASQLPTQLVSAPVSDTSLWYRYYSAGVNELRLRHYESAEKSLLASIKEAKNARGRAEELAKSRNALGQLYCAEHAYKEAEPLFTWALATTKRHQDEAQLAESLCGLATVYVHSNQGVKARSMAEQALKSYAKCKGETSNEYGSALVVLAQSLSQSNLLPEAEATFNDALKILAENPGFHELDYAEGLRAAALFYQASGNVAAARPLFERSYAIKDKSVQLAQPPTLAGNLDYSWENGSPRALEFPDVDVPLRYITAGDARVATAVVDLWELFGVLISITNVSDHQINVGVTSASLLEMPHRTPLEPVDPNRIDHIRRERQVWDITYKRPWLANIQKTRTTRGFVPAQGHDLFRGPNVFGLYGSWGGAPRILPDKLALELSPERVVEQGQAEYDPTIIHSAEQNLQGLTTFTLEPFESRTGILFYMNPRCESVLLKVPIGNVLFEFPFTCRKRRIAALESWPILSRQ